MPSDEQKPKRAPRGSGPVSQAFLKALESIPAHSQGEVAKAALVLIRDELKGREKLKPKKQGANKPRPLGRKTVAATETAQPPASKPSRKLKTRKQVSAKAAA